MSTSTVDDLIDDIKSGFCYKPGFEFKAIDWSQRHAGSILVQVTYKTHDYSRQFAPDYDKHDQLEVPFYFTITPAHYDNDVEFWREFYNQLQRLDSHENREAFRLWDGERWVGIFNPHEPAGQLNWGDLPEDMQFGDLSISGVANLF